MAYSADPIYRDAFRGGVGHRMPRVLSMRVRTLSLQKPNSPRSMNS
jgi:hypothetical protein